MARTLKSDMAALGSRIGEAVPGWVGGAMAGVQSAALGLGAVVAVALAVAAVAPQPDGSAGVDWEGAAGVGARFWLLAHGVPAGSDGTVVSLVPLGLTLVFASLTSGLARRFSAPTAGGAIAVAVAYALVCVLVARAVAAPAGTHAPVRAGLVGLAVAGAGAFAGLRRARRFRFASAGRFPAWVAAGARLGTSTALLGWGAGALAFGAWMVAGHADVGAAAEGLSLDPVGAVALAAGEAAYAPTLAAWGLAWLAGPGFSVGDGTSYAPGEVAGGPLPSIPILGALPQASGGPLVLVPAVVAAVGAVAWLLSRHRLPPGRPAFATGAWAAVVAGAWAVVGSWASRGGIGGGRLAHAGSDPAATGLAVAILAGLGMGVAALILAGRSGVSPPRARPRRTTAEASPRPPRASRPTRPGTPSRTPARR